MCTCIAKFFFNLAIIGFNLFPIRKWTRTSMRQRERKVAKGREKLILEMGSLQWAAFIPEGDWPRRAGEKAIKSFYLMKLGKIY